MTAQEMREAREKALLKAYEKAATEIYHQMFMVHTEEGISQKTARYHIHRMDLLFGDEYAEIGKLYGFDPEDD